MEQKEREKILIGLIAFFCALAVIGWGIAYSIQCERVIDHQNIKALMDTLTVVNTKNDELIAYKNSYVLEKKDLESYIDIKENEIKSLEKQLKSKVQYISKIESKIHTDTIIIRDSIKYIDSCVYYHFNEENEYYKIGGYTHVHGNEYSETIITDNAMNLKLNVGVDDEWRIFVKTDNPYVSFSTIDGALLNKDIFLKQQKKPHFGVSLQAGIGAQYGLIHKTFDVGPYIGIGINYILFSR